MIPAFVAYSYELTGEGRKAAAIISFHALGWMAGILATGAVGDIRLAFLASSGFFDRSAVDMAASRGGVWFGARTRVDPADSLSEPVPVLDGTAAAHSGDLGVDRAARNND